MTRKRVVIVDDSATMRAMIHQALKTDGRFEVVGEAADPFDAREVIKRTNPDVITLDVEMPRMDGLSFLEKIMRLRPMPVVMFSTETHRGSRAAVEALSIGAIDALGKPQSAAPDVLAQLAERVHVAAGATVAASRPERTQAAPTRFAWNGKTALIGASTGGVDALERVIGALPPDAPPVLITQHMPESFLASFAERLDGLSRARVRLAEHGARVAQGCVYLAPGGRYHLQIAGPAGRQRCELHAGEKVSGHRPSVDMLFASAVPAAAQTVAVLLTGMGSDGAEGMRKLRAAGSHTIGQDEATSVVYGMPRVAAELGAVAEVCPLDSVADALLRATGRRAAAAPGSGAAAAGMGRPPAAPPT